MSSVAWRADQTSTRGSRQERTQLSVRLPASGQTTLEEAQEGHLASEQRRERLERVIWLAFCIFLDREIL